MAFYGWDTIKATPYGTVEYWAREGLIDRATWHRYCYEWRSTFRLSSLGQAEAAEHARANGLPLAYSDRPLEIPGPGCKASCTNKIHGHAVQS